MKLISLIAALGTGLAGLAAIAAPPQNQWQQPASALADQIAEILGPGQAQLTLRNISSIPSDAVPGIRKVLDQDLKAHGVLVSDAESTNSIHVTLSENTRERLWIAEVIEGNVSKVVMVHVDSAAPTAPALDSHMILRKERIRMTTSSNEPILAAFESNGSLILLHPESISVLKLTAAGWTEQKAFPLGHRQSLTRDPRGIFSPGPDSGSFTSYAPGTLCTGSRGGSVLDWNIQCDASDDPWPLSSGSVAIKAFFNPARNYFTGVVTPSLGADLPPFYSAALVPRPAGGIALLITGIDGKVQLLDNGALRSITGTRDWGSDIAVFQSGCGAGTQILTSSSGAAANDSVRAFELPALEAIPSSAPLSMDGTVTALSTAPDGKSAFAVVRNAENEYEVDRVTALCN